MIITDISQLDLTKQYTYADYLAWRIEERLELIKGWISRMSAPSRAHQETLGELTFCMRSHFGNHRCKVYFAPSDVRFLDKEKSSKANKNIYTVVQPDLYVVCDLKKLDDAGCLGAPDLVVEILSSGNTKKEMKQKYDVYEENENYNTQVYFTRLHIRYNRKQFPQDLMFQVTPNQENYQARYIITHPASGDFSCEAGKKYLKELKERRKNELEQLDYLTGKNYENWDMAYDEGAATNTDAAYKVVAAGMAGNNNDDGQDDKKSPMGLYIAVLSSLGLLILTRRFRPHPLRA